jgi:4-hydroxy-3-polyprenylbenzoate decarboxylase
MGKYLICITGASGSVYGLRTIQALADLNHEVHVVVSPWGDRVMREETGRNATTWFAEYGIPANRTYRADDLAAAPSSGSFRIDGTIIVPCSMSTIGALASGATTNLVHRAGTVALKEGRPLLLVPRESPLSLIDLRNLTNLAEGGAAILPASPGFYHGPVSIADLVDFMTGKILDRLGLSHHLFKRWEGTTMHSDSITDSAADPHADTGQHPGTGR